MDPASDVPVPFGYKTAWYAVRARSSAEVIEKLQLRVLRESTFREGIEKSAEDGVLFVSPRIGGFVLVIGVKDPPFTMDLIRAHAQKFTELQYFCTHRVAEYHVWARWNSGGERIYGYVGESGKVLWNTGEMTAQESALGFAAFPPTSEDLFTEEYPKEPNEEHVLKIAAAWGIDTSFPEALPIEGRGVLAAPG